jgi:hypothetical protein
MSIDSVHFNALACRPKENPWIRKSEKIVKCPQRWQVVHREPGTFVSRIQTQLHTQNSYWTPLLCIIIYCEKMTLGSMKLEGRKSHAHLFIQKNELILDTNHVIFVLLSFEIIIHCITIVTNCSLRLQMYPSHKLEIGLKEIFVLLETWTNLCFDNTWKYLSNFLLHNSNSILIKQNGHC